MNLPILDRYLAKQVISMILIVSLALLGIDLFFSLVAELKAIGKGTYSAAAALQFLILTAPTRFYIMFPWSALIGTLVCLGMLANHRELVVMRTASVSVYRIAWSVVKAAIILTLCMVILGEIIAPIGDRIAQNKRTLALSGGQSIETDYGIWIRNDQEFIHIQAIRANGDLVGVTRYQFDDERRLKQVSLAENAVREKNGWVLHNIKGTRFTPNKTEIIKSERFIVPNLLEPEILETASVKHPERLSLAALYRTIQHRFKNELNANSYELAFWRKVFQPALIIIMVFIAVPFVFGPLRSSGMGYRIFAGILVAYLFHTINSMFAPLAMVYKIPVIISVIIPLILFSSVAFVLLKRVK